jgi:hypothetical protein
VSFECAFIADRQIGRTEKGEAGPEDSTGFKNTGVMKDEGQYLQESALFS